MAKKYELKATRNIHLLSHGKVLRAGEILVVDELTSEDKDQESLGALRVEEFVEKKTKITFPVIDPKKGAGTVKGAKKPKKSAHKKK